MYASFSFPLRSDKNVPYDKVPPAPGRACVPKILVSYRRDDSRDIAGRMPDSLAEEFGKDSVFMDVDSIPTGVDFTEYIADHIRNSDIVIAVIGQNWLGRTEAGPRIQAADDPVRVELEQALRQGVQIWPVLVNNGRMPSPEDLPESLKALAHRNAAEVSGGRDFHGQMERLIAEVQRATSSPRRKLDSRLIGIAAGLGVLLLGGGYWLSGLRAQSPSSCGDESRLRSPSDEGKSVTLDVHNNTDKDKSLIWINFDGKREPYAKLARKSL
jgi:hypothetical protein